MASSQQTVDFITEQMSSAGSALRSRKMFGEYAVYCDEKVIALVCDDKLFLKITDTIVDPMLKEAEQGSAYPGSKPYYVISEDLWDDAALMAKLAQATADVLPAPKPKKSKQK